MVLRRTFSKAYKSYRHAVEDAFSRKNLIYTNLFLSMGISALGDTIEQNYELYSKEIEKVDYTRTFQMGFSGLSAGFICHHWYILLDKVIIGKSVAMVLKKLFMDQFICSPICIMSFFATVAIFEDNPLDSFTEEVRDKFWILYKAEWVVWPPAQIINFYFLPTQYRILYDNTISLGYEVFTSHIKHKKPNSSKTEQD